MKKFSLSKLEEARLNPSNFVNMLNKSDNLKDSNLYRYSRYMCWQNAALHFHKFNNRRLALQYLEEGLNKFKIIKKTPSLIEDYQDKLDYYISDFKQNNFYFIESRKIINMQLSKELLITSKIPVVTMIKDKDYFVYFFSIKYYQWEKELKFPILQSHFAESEFGCELSEVNVGIYCYETDVHYQNNYSEKEVKVALDELSELSIYITKRLKVK